MATKKRLNPQQILARLSIVIEGQSAADVLPPIISVLNHLSAIAVKHPATHSYLAANLETILQRLTTEPATVDSQIVSPLVTP